MAYVNVNPNYRKEDVPEAPKQSTLSQAAQLTQTGIKAVDYLNTRNERLLAESGYLDLKIPESDKIGENWNMFERKPGRGPLRGPEDRIQLSDKGRKYLDKKATLNNTTSIEEYSKFVNDRYGENSKLLDSIGGKESIEEAKSVFKNMNKRQAGIKDIGMDLMNTANESINQIIPNTVNHNFKLPNFGGKPGGVGFDTNVLPNRIGSANIGMKPIMNENNFPKGLNSFESNFNQSPLSSAVNLPDMPSPSPNIGFSPENMGPGVEAGLDGTSFMNKAMDPKGAIRGKIASGLGMKPGLLSGMGPMGMFAQMALGQLGQKVFKPHTVVGKLFKNLF